MASSLSTLSVGVCLWWQFDWSFARLRVPVVITASFIISCCSRIQDGLRFWYQGALVAVWLQVRISARATSQPSIPPGLVIECQLYLGRQRQVWLIPIADERVGVQVKLWNPLRTHAITEHFFGGDSLRRGAISSVCIFTFTLPGCRGSWRLKRVVVVISKWADWSQHSLAIGLLFISCNGEWVLCIWYVAVIRVQAVVTSVRLPIHPRSATMLPGIAVKLHTASILYCLILCQCWSPVNSI